MGKSEDKIVIILRGHFGSVNQASKRIGVTPAALMTMLKKPPQRRNLLKYLPQLVEHTGLTAQELYDAIV